MGRVGREQSNGGSDAEDPRREPREHGRAPHGRDLGVRLCPADGPAGIGGARGPAGLDLVRAARQGEGGLFAVAGDAGHRQERFPGSGRGSSAARGWWRRWPPSIHTARCGLHAGPGPLLHRVRRRSSERAVPGLRPDAVSMPPTTKDRGRAAGRARSSCPRRTRLRSISWPTRSRGAWGTRTVPPRPTSPTASARRTPPPRGSLEARGPASWHLPSAHDPSRHGRRE
jgi:hypothetical protein